MSDQLIGEPPPRRPDRLSSLVTLRTLLLAALLTALFSTGAATLVATALIDRGSAGPRGPAGPAGPQGEAGEATISDEDVLTAIENDPGRVASAVQDELDPSPSDISSTVDDLSSTVDELDSRVGTLRDDFDSLCSDLALADALSDVALSC
jgi:hypothetical protein